MARLLNYFIHRLAEAGQTPSSSSKGKSAGGSSQKGISGFNRDPKATQVKRVGYQISSSTSSGSGGSGRGNFESPEADFDTIDNAIERDSYVMQTVTKYNELIFKSGWEFKSKNQQALDYVKLRLAVIAIATQTTTEELLLGIANDLVRYANCFIVKARGKGSQGLPPGLSAIPMPPAKGPVVGYFRLPPSTMQVGRDLNGNITGYQQTIQGQKPVSFRPEDVIHIKVNVSTGKAFGSPWMAPVIEDVRLLRKVEENAALLLYRHIFPLLAYTVGLDKPGFEATDDELTELRATLENLPTDGALVLPERHKVEAINLTAIDGRPYLDYFEARVFSGLGMSTVDFGRGDTSNRNTADVMTGIKADRVKGWQEQISIQVTHTIIEELLVEGGFDPIVDPTNLVSLVFNEIEAEQKIKLDTHEIYKFEHNVQTWDETRVNLKMDPSADESRLYLNMIKIPEIEATANAKMEAAGPSGTPETNNKQKPTNQHGTRSGPKKSTESAETDEVAEPAFSKFGHLFESHIENLESSLEFTYRSMEKDVLEAVKKRINAKEFPLRNVELTLASIQLSRDSMVEKIKHSSRQSLMNGVTEAKSQFGRAKLANISYDKAIRALEDSVTKSIESLEKDLKKVLKEKLNESSDVTKSIAVIRGTFESLRYRIKFISRNSLAKAYNYGFVLSAIKYEESYVSSLYQEGECTRCIEKSEEKIDIRKMSSLGELAILDAIPPWHTNCNCMLVKAD